MAPVEQLLSDTADYLESRLREDRVLREQLRALLEAGNKPHCTRVLGAEMPDAMATILVEPVP